MDAPSLIMKYLVSAAFFEAGMMTLLVTVLSVLLGVLIGLLIAVMQESRIAAVQPLVIVYLWLFRGTPVLFQIIFIFNVLPQFGILLSGFACGIIALSLNEAAYMSEILRSGLQAVGRGQRMAGRALGMTDLYQRQTEAAIHNFERAVDRDPHEAENHALLGNAWGAAGNYEEALRHVEYAVALSPRDAFLNSWYNILAMAAVAVGRDAEAVEWAKKTIAENPQFPGGHRSLAAAYGCLGELTEAKAALETLLELLPGLTIADLRERLPVAIPDQLERYLNGLRAAGLAD